MLLLASMVILFTACGGGGSSGGTAPVNPQPPQITGIDKIKAYADDSTLSAPTVEDYADAGVIGVTEDNVADINAVVADLTAEDVNTPEKIQALADILPVVVKFLDLMKQPSGDDVKVLFTYDGNENRLTEKRERADDFGVWKHESQYSYDFNTNEATETWVKTYVGTNYSSDATGTNIYTFDDKGVVLTIFISSSLGYTIDVVYSYNDQGNIETLSSTTDNGYSSLSTYDNSGNMIEESWEYFDGSSGLTTYTYNSNGVLLASAHTSTSSDGSSSQSSTTYDGNGNIMTSESMWIQSDGSWNKDKSTYDSNGNPLTVLAEDSLGNHSESTYTYDSNGNLLTSNHTSINADGSSYYSRSIYSDSALRESSYKFISTDGSWYGCTSTYDKNGNLIDSDCDSVDLGPIANAGSDLSVYVNQAITITGSGVDSDGTIVSYEWRKGTVIVAATASFEYMPTAVGTDTLTLTVINDDGATVSDNMTVIVTEVPIVVKFRDFMRREGDDIKVSFTYDENGNRLTEEREDISIPYGPIGVVSTEWRYESQYSYDFNTNEATETWIDICCGSKQTGTNIYIFDDNGSVLKFSNASRTDIYTYDNLGNIKTLLHTATYGYSSLITYDNNGNKIEVSSEDRAIDGSGLSTYTYDEKGNILTSEGKYSELSGLSSQSSSIYTYDEKGNILKREDTHTNAFSDGSSSQSSSIYTYDANGNILTRENTSTSSDGSSSQSSFIYTYDSNGDLIADTYTSAYSDGLSSQRSSIYTYDEKGKILTRDDTSTSSDGSSSQGSSIYTYNTNGTLRMYSWLYTRSDGSWEEYIATYDEDGNFIDEKWESGLSQ